MRLSFFLLLLLAATALAELKLDIGMETVMDIDEDELQEDTEPFDRENLIGEKWFYMDESGDRTGPLFFEDIKSAFFKGKLNLFSRVWKPEWESWRMFKTIPGLRSYLKENLDIKQQLQLIAVDDQIFVQEIRKAEASTPGGSSPLDGAMLCSKATALAEILRRGVSKSLLKEILQEAISAEAERSKMIKVRRALKFANGVAAKNATDAQIPVRTELIQLIRALKLLKEKKLIEGGDEAATTSGIWSILLQHSIGEELFLLYLTAKEEPMSLVEPACAVAGILMILYLILKIFAMIVSVLL